MKDFFGIKELGVNDLEGVAGGVSYGSINIDEASFREQLAAYKSQGCTYEDVMELIGEDIDGCTDDEKAFAMDYFDKVWKSL